MTQARTAYTRRARLDSESVRLDEPTQDVDHSRIATTGIALPDARGIEGEPPTGNVKAALAEEQFMAQSVEVIFGEPGNEHEHQFIEAGVNGEKFCARRGDSARVKRSILAVIAAAKAARLKQVKTVEADGSMGYKETSVLQPMYPFTVISDPAGERGITWLRQILQRS